ISQQWIVPANSNPALSCVLEISFAPNGVVTDVQINKTSGDPILDRSAITAVYKASPLPVPTDPNLFKLMQKITLTVQPKNVT
ncbi:MAG: cell envelope integrity protein TolA, partial [Gammaproteobacteria bacterium]